MDRLLKGLLGLLRGVLDLALGLAVLALVFGGIGFLVWAAGASVEWATAKRDCGLPARPVSELMAAVSGGHLFARRAALYELPCAVPKSPTELADLAAAAGQTGRRRLRTAAVAAIGRAGAGEKALDPALRRLLSCGDRGVEDSAFKSLRAMGAGDDDPDLAAFLASHPELRVPAGAAAVDQAAAARTAERAAAIAAVTLRADPARFAALRAAAASPGPATTDSLLADPSFIVAGAEAGAVLARAGRLDRAGARALASGEDPVLQDVGLGALDALGDAAGFSAALSRRGGR